MKHAIITKFIGRPFITHNTRYTAKSMYQLHLLLPVNQAYIWNYDKLENTQNSHSSEKT